MTNTPIEKLDHEVEKRFDEKFIQKDRSGRRYLISRSTNDLTVAEMLKGFLAQELSQAIKQARSEAIDGVLRTIDTHIRHLYPYTFANSYSGAMARGKQAPTHIAKFEESDYEALTQLEFISKQIEALKKE